MILFWGLIDILFYIYSRKSVDTGRGDSIENQITLCRQYILSKYPETAPTEIKIYEDEGFSGKTTNRPEFQRMLGDFNQNPPDFLVCYLLDRISRNVGDFASLIEFLNQKHINFLCIREEFDTSKPMGKAMLYIASVFAQLERETIAQRVGDNMRLLARSGRWLGGTPPLGYSAQEYGDEKNSVYLSPIPQEIDIIRQIFTQFLSIQSISGLEKWLTDKKIKTRGNKNFSLLSLRDILQNPVYAIADGDIYGYFLEKNADVAFNLTKNPSNFGLIAYNKRDYSQKNMPRRDISHWIVALGKHPGVVSGADWISVQQILGGNKTPALSPSHNDYALLSGLLRCPHCGGRMFAKNRWNREGFDYICQQKLRGGKQRCPCQNLSGQATDQIIFDGLLPWLTPSSPSAILSKIKLSPSGIPANQTAQRIQSCRQQMDNLIKTLATGSPSEGLITAIDKKLLELQCEVDSLADILNQQDFFSSDISITAGKILSLMDMPSLLNVSDKRTLLRLLLEKILWQDGILTPIFRSPVALSLEGDSPPSSQF